MAETPLIAAGDVCPSLPLADDSGVTREMSSFWQGAREGAIFFLYPKANTGG